jgi:adenine-specific DNA-methyltransferase
MGNSSESLAPLDSCKVYTPRKLAGAMVSALGGDGERMWLEPGFGKGVFLEALSAVGVSKANILAIDLDFKASENDSLANVLRGVDFLDWASDQQANYDCVVGNPPYLAIRELPEPHRTKAARVSDLRGRAIGRIANTWYAFLLSSLRVLREGGSLAFVLPAACEYADYCKPGREGITQMFERVDLIRSQRPLFQEVQEGAAVLICHNKRRGPGVFRRHEVADLDETIQRLHRLTDHKARTCLARSNNLTGHQIRLGDIVSVRLGGVTGDTRFFTLSEDRRRELGLPVGSLQRVVTKCRHIRRPWVNPGDWNRLKEQGERVWLLNPSAAMADNPEVKKYLGLDQNAGGCRRGGYKVQNRDPWFRTPMPSDPQGFISGMCSDGVWICVNEMSELNATNTLYVIQFQGYLSVNERYACALSLLTTPVSNRLRRIRRRYADGLEKIEPSQISDLHIPSFNHVVGAKSSYRKALSLLLNGQQRESRRIADVALLG